MVSMPLGRPRSKNHIIIGQLGKLHTNDLIDEIIQYAMVQIFSIYAWVIYKKNNSESKDQTIVI